MNLTKNSRAIAYLVKERGFTKKEVISLLIEKFHVGCDGESFRNFITFPVVYNNIVERVNGRNYTNSGTKYKTKIYSKTSRYFFGQDVFRNHNKIVITESPLDCLSLNAVKIPAVSLFGTSHGLHTDLSYLSGKKICIMFDNDQNKAGKRGAERLAKFIYRNTKINPKIAFLTEYKDHNQLFREDRDKLYENVIYGIDHGYYLSIDELENNHNYSIKNRNTFEFDIVKTISPFVELKRIGNGVLQGFCPFHNDGRHPAFTVYESTNRYYCFGCRATGTPVGFILNMFKGYSAKQAVTYLREVHNV